MSISFGQATKRLLSGFELSWPASGAAHGGTVTLSTPSQRRLFSYLLDADSGDVAEGSDILFDGMIAAWKDEESDPTPEVSDMGADTRSGPWRLHRIETTNFGGLNTYNGPAFTLEIGGENWCLEGSNGSGKTMLVSAIIWALTGYRLREHDGLDSKGGVPEPVYNKAGQKIGAWPPLVTYPESADKLADTATAKVTLVFADSSGDQALVSRAIFSQENGDEDITVDIDPRLTAVVQMIEAGLLMPARLAHIGFGAKSGSLYEAMKMLTGLDRLADIALGVSAFCNKGRRFLKYAKDNGIARLETSFETDIGKARELAEDAKLTIPEKIILGDEKLFRNLLDLANAASTQAGNLLTLLKSEISEKIDLTTIDGRRQLLRAVNSARDIVEKKTKGVAVFAAWAALKNASEDDSFTSLFDRVADLEAKLETSLKWHAKQLADDKLRLKALASRFFLPSDELTVSETCPLCAQHLKTEDQRALAAELKALKADAEAAERSIQDACSDIDKALHALLPRPIREYFEVLTSMNPASDYGTAVRERYVSAAPFSNVLVGIARSVEKHVTLQTASLPDFHYQSFEPAQTEPAPATELRLFIHNIRRVVALVDWWEEHRGVFVDAWSTLLGKSDEDSKQTIQSIESMLKNLEEASEKAEPLDKIATHLNNAIGTGTKWVDINSEQKTREDIAKALEPLKALKNLVDAETHRTIQSLSGRVGAILNDIRLKDRFDFEDTKLNKREVTVHGRFGEDYKIDAQLVANASWLRAILWAFIFAMREEAIEAHGCCTFPLVVLDDPQLTFDPKNKRKWAEKIVNLANAAPSQVESAQLFLATHERQFFDIVTGANGLIGEKGMIARPHGEFGVAQILNGTKLERGFAKAKAEGCDEQAYNYVRDVRVYCEDLLRIMLRPESYELTENTLGSLKGLLVRYQQTHVSPFNRPIFKRLTTALSEQNDDAVVYMNATSHTNDGTIGLAQAEDVDRYWKETLEKRFSEAFMLAADYDSYGGDSRLYAYPETIIEFPVTPSSAIAGANLLKTGIAAAAASDGRVGDGTISIEEWGHTDPLKLHNHSAYSISGTTLEPVATIGDIVLVKNYGEPQAQDLVVVAHGDHFVARRLHLPEEHHGMAVLTGQGTNPYMHPDPIIVPVDKLPMRKIVGTLFIPARTPSPIVSGDVIPLDDTSKLTSLLDGAHLFKVTGRSMEPIALEDQLVITREEIVDSTTLRRFDGTLVIAIDDSGARYFKRLRHRDNLIILESANSDASTPSEILSLDGGAYPMLTKILSVVGILFEEP